MSEEEINAEMAHVEGWCPRSKCPIFSKPIKVAVMTPLLRKMVNDKLAIAHNAHDCTYEEVQEAEYKAWHEPGKDWDLYTKNRPYHTKGYTRAAPKAGDPAPDGPVYSLNEGAAASTLLAEAKKLGDSEGSRYVAVSFDSVTCPVWRAFGGQDLAHAAAHKKLPVLHVYIREAHAIDEFQTPMNEGGPLALAHQIKLHVSEADRRAAAKEGHALISRQLGSSVTMVFDGLDDKLEKAYEARPFRMYVLDVQEGKVAHATGLAPFNVPAKVKDLKAFTA